MWTNFEATVMQKPSEMARRVSREEGLFAGGSAGLMVHAAVELAKELDDPNAFVVTLICDWGERYLSKTYDDEWMRENGFLERARRLSLLEAVTSKDSRVSGLVTVEPTDSGPDRPICDHGP